MSRPADETPLILVVDDEPSNVDVLCDLLEALDYRTVGAGSGDAALALARDREPDLVLLDLMMPGMDGLEVCRRLKADAATASIPVVFVTALSDAEDRARGIEAGGDDFLTKPFSRPVLVGGPGVSIRLSAVAAEGGVKFTVADDGVGIAEADHDAIFRKYGRRGDADGGGAPAGGSGLGLTFCKLAVEAHGGRIWVQSRAGEGAAFHFLLPPRPSRNS